MYAPPPSTQPESSLRGSALWLCLALALLLVQTIPFLSYRWVTDESWYAAPGYAFMQGHGLKDIAIGPNDIESRLDVRPPGTALVIATGFRLFGPGQIPARLGSVLAGALVVLFTWLLARRLVGWPGTLAAVLVVATDNLIVLTSRTARPESLTVAAVLAALLALSQYARQPRVAWAFAAGLLLAVGTMFHITLLGYIVAGALLLVYLDFAAGRRFLPGAFCFTAAYLAGLLPFAVWIFSAPLGRQAFAQEYLSRAHHASYGAKLLEEGQRYTDLLGLNVLHGHGLQFIPVRLPIPLFFLFASVLLWRYRRHWFYLELLFLAPNMLWLVYTVNKSSRYTALLSPLFALTLGAAVTVAAGRPRLCRLIIAGVALTVAMQAGANVLLLRSARAADFNRLTAQFHSIIPPAATVCGTMEFWLAFRDQTFISYERTPPPMAAEQDGAAYFIFGDRMMTVGTATEPEYYRQLQAGFAQVAARSTVAGTIDDPYYGHLVIYHLQR